jgi:hypothetical protein
MFIETMQQPLDEMKECGNERPNIDVSDSAKSVVEPRRQSYYPTFYNVIGWKELDASNIPTEPCVVVYSHTSHMDMTPFVAYKIHYKQVKNMVPIVSPALKVWYYFLVRWLLNPIYSPPLGTKKNNSTKDIIEQFKNVPSTKESPRLLMISPKGHIYKREWRSGYYYIAKECGYKVYPLILDYSKRELYFGLPIDPQFMSLEDATTCLQKQLGSCGPITPEYAEFPIHDSDYQVFEALSSADMCAVSLAAYIPFMLSLFYSGYYMELWLALTSFIVSWRFHLDKEGTTRQLFTEVYQRVEGTLAHTSIVLRIIHTLYDNGGYLSGIGLLNMFMATVFMLLSEPRGVEIRRGKYALYMPLYHVFMGFALYSLPG